jgi:hypothetical protein
MPLGLIGDTVSCNPVAAVAASSAVVMWQCRHSEQLMGSQKGTPGDTGLRGSFVTDRDDTCHMHGRRDMQRESRGNVPTKADDCRRMPHEDCNRWRWCWRHGAAGAVTTPPPARIGFVSLQFPMNIVPKMYDFLLTIVPMMTCLSRSEILLYLCAPGCR